LEIGGEPIDHFRAPTLPRLIGENVAADFPVVKDELSVRSEGGSNLRSANALFDAGEEASVTLCNRLLHNLPSALISAWRSCFQELHEGRKIAEI
jgi:hypothetical protein